MLTVVSTLSPELEAAFLDASIVALDIEGVDLGRDGVISLVQLAVPDKCFLLDMLPMPDASLVSWLRCILESKSVLKIIHDCRMDSDALKHCLGIDLTNVHDTSAWHSVRDQGLNTVLVCNGLKPNVQRDSNVYANNHAFWATRPLTSKMIEWASGDVASMFDLYRGQTKKDLFFGNDLSEQYINMARAAKTAFVTVRNIGLFIGRGGSNIRSLQTRTNTLIYPRGKRDRKQFLVYYINESSFTEVLMCAGA